MHGLSLPVREKDVSEAESVHLVSCLTMVISIDSYAVTELATVHVCSRGGGSEDDTYHK